MRRAWFVVIFQLTLPVWGATRPTCNVGKRDAISTHAPRVGSDRWEVTGYPSSDVFQLTLPVWGATRQRLHAHRARLISTHAPRVGSDRLNF